MPWKETCPMDQRKRFIEDYLKRRMSMTELCWSYGVSRKTGHKWVNRFRAQGPEGLQDQSRAPGRHPNATAQEIVCRIVAIRTRYPRWGPRKLLAKLSREDPAQPWPCPSTIGAILKRRGLVPSRKKRRRVPPYTEPFLDCEGPNDVWCADFKGWFRTDDGHRCDPLTISDAYSRFLLRCQAVPRADFVCTQPLFETVFREFGLPLAIRTDNGPPFASLGLAGLSRLAIWWIKLGIRVERIEPGKPQQNGRHERMHKTLKESTASPPREDLDSQQRAFDRFWEEYNFDRPHEALDMRTPGQLYRSSPREYPARLREVEYPDNYLVRRVRHNGCIKWKKELFLSETLARETVGLKWTGEHELDIYFGPVKLAVLDLKSRRIIKDRARGGAGPK